MTTFKQNLEQELRDIQNQMTKEELDQLNKEYEEDLAQLARDLGADKPAGIA